MSLMPGPWSRATTTSPIRSSWFTSVRLTSPRFAYMTMLRAISEIAAAITVWSPSEKPAFPASSRPFWRTVTMSTSEPTGRSVSSGTIEALLGIALQEGESLFQVQRGGDPLQGQAQLHHGKGDFGLDPDDHGLGAAQ